MFCIENWLSLFSLKDWKEMLKFSTVAKRNVPTNQSYLKLYPITCHLQILWGIQWDMNIVLQRGQGGEWG